MAGIIDAPIPSPSRTSRSASSVYEVSASRNANGIVPTVRISSPTTATRPPPSLSVSRPAIGIAIAAPKPCGAISRPAVSADSPRATW